MHSVEKKKKNKSPDSIFLKTTDLNESEYHCYFTLLWEYFTVQEERNITPYLSHLFMVFYFTEMPIRNFTAAHLD